MFVRLIAVEATNQSYTLESSSRTHQQATSATTKHPDSTSRPARNSDPGAKQDSRPLQPVEHTKPGTELEVETLTKRTSAVVVRRPFIDPQKEIPKQPLATAAARDE